MITDTEIAATLARVDALLDDLEFPRDLLWARARNARAASAGTAAVALAVGALRSDEPPYGGRRMPEQDGPNGPRVSAPVPAPHAPRPGGAAVPLPTSSEWLASPERDACDLRAEYHAIEAYRAGRDCEIAF